MTLKYFGKNNKIHHNKESIAVIEYREDEKEKIKKVIKALEEKNWEYTVSDDSIFVTLYGGVPQFKAFKKYWWVIKKYML